tara:strand:+ start:10421 stop:15685 length:5265 start_codon:yes stop_codon:yes gene_type:complete
MLKIYKLYRLNQSKNIEKIYVFTNDEEKAKKSDIFSKEEQAKIKNDKIKIDYVNKLIYEDDTVRRIKEKIINYLDLNILIDELYLFTSIKRQMDSIETFKTLTQNNSVPLTFPRLCQFLMNIDGLNDSKCDEIIKSPEEMYNYDEFMNLNIINWSKTYSALISLGNKFQLKNVLNYPINPFNAIYLDDLIKKNIRINFSQENNKVLFEYGDITDNIMYFTTAEDVLNQKDKILTDEEYLMMYFPILYRKNIRESKQMTDHRMQEFKKEADDYTERFEKYNKTIDNFNLLHQASNKIDYTDEGITKAMLTLYQKNAIKMPLEIIFKLIKTNNELSMIKYNPGKKIENIYRFYSDKKNTEGKKIPSLYFNSNSTNKRNYILKLAKVMGQKKCICYHIYTEIDKEKLNIFCELNQNGELEVHMQFKKERDIHFIEHILKEKVNNYILKPISNYIRQSGFTFNIFENMDDPNLQVNNIVYNIKLKNDKPIVFDKYSNSIATLFEIDNSKIEKRGDNITLKYKRVSNYNKMSLMSAFITQQYNLNKKEHEILMLLELNFQLTKDQAKDEYIKWVGEVQTQLNVFQNRKILKENPGFPITISSVAMLENGVLLSGNHIRIENINNFRYIGFLKKYLNAILSIFISPGENKPLLDKLKKNDKIKEIEVVDIVGETEKVFKEKKDIVGVQDDKVVFDANELEISDLDSDLDDGLLFDDDDEISDSESEGEGDDKDEEEDDTKSTTSEKLTDLYDVDENMVDVVIKKVVTPDKKNSKIEATYEGKPLSGVKGIFTKRLKDRDGELFIKDTGRFASYVKTCPWNVKKQPVSLTDEELAYIKQKDAENGTKSFDEHITYGSTETKKHHYICPRFWCLRDEEGKQRSISMKEINEGKCGGWDAIIPEKSKTVPKGKRIFEFTDAREHRMNLRNNHKLVYRQHYPNYQVDKHPKGLCVPCCYTMPRDIESDDWKVKVVGNQIKFKNKKTEEVKNNINILTDFYEARPVPEYEEDEKGNVKFETVKGKTRKRPKPSIERRNAFAKCDMGEGNEIEEIKNTKIGRENPLLTLFPLGKNQLGYISVQMEKLFGYSNLHKCFISKNDTNLKTNVTCVMRKGVENNTSQSFLEAIRYIYNDEHEKIDVNSVRNHSEVELTMKALKKKICDIVTIDNFITYENGNLVDLFYNKDKKSKKNYSNTKFKKELNKSKISKKMKEKYFEKVASAYENFLDYINDSNAKINYKYLWEIITRPRSEGGLFNDGVNLILFNSPEDDDSNKIELICLANEVNYDSRKKSVILYTKNDYYEPICMIEKLGTKKYKVKKQFDHDEISRHLPKIKTLVNKCTALSRKPTNKYNFVNNISLDKIIELLKDKDGFKLKKQIVNLNTNVVGILFELNKKEYYIPCAPSMIKIDIPFIYTNNLFELENSDKMFNQVKMVDNLRELKRIEPNILCEPRMKIIKDNMVVGIITETNQQIPVVPVIHQGEEGSGKKDDDDLMIYNINNYSKESNQLLIDNEIIMDDTEDEKRKTIIKKIKIESNFYNIFRSLFRIVINKYSNKQKKTALIRLINDKSKSYVSKLTKIKEEIKKLMHGYIEFSKYKLIDMEDINNIYYCFELDKKKCKEASVCFYSKDNKCKFKISKYNLMSNERNDKLYYRKLSDEILRYSRIRSFIFSENKFLSFQNVEYQLTENELVLLEIILTDNYFENTKLKEKNSYINKENNVEKHDVNKHNFVELKDMPKLKSRSKQSSKKNVSLSPLDSLSPLE